MLNTINGSDWARSLAAARATGNLVSQIGAVRLRCPDCGRNSSAGQVALHSFGGYGRFGECPRCGVGSLAQDWREVG